MRWLVPLALLLAVSAHANTILVPEQYPTIQAGLNAAAPWDTISVAPGTYFENVSFPVDDLTLVSRVRHGATIDGGGTGHVVIFNNRTGTIDGFVVTHAAARFQAGIFTSQKSQTIAHCVITDNPAHGITLSSGSQAWIEANEIHHNGGSSSYLEAIDAITDATAVIVDNLVYANAGGILIRDGQNYIFNNTIVNNRAYNVFLTCHARIANNVITGSDLGIYFAGGPYDSDISRAVAKSLWIHHNDVWNNGTEYYAEIEANQGAFVPLPGRDPTGAGYRAELDVDPQFVGAGDFHLLVTSPCIDAGGSTGWWPPLPDTDLDGNPRHVGTVDIGAYESSTTRDLVLSDAVTGARPGNLMASPNPFRSATLVTFEVAAPSQVSLAVFDVAGRLVRTLVEEHSSGRVHAVRWDGRDDAGARVASGTYFVRLAAGDVSRVRKVAYLSAR